MRLRRAKAPVPTDPLGLTAPESAAMRRWMRTTTPPAIDAIWSFVGQNPDGYCEPPRRSALKQQRLIEVLASHAAREVADGGYGYAKSRGRRFLRRHWLEAVAVVFLLAVVGGVARANVAYWGEGAWGLTPHVIAVRPIAAGVTMTAEDLELARLPRRAGFATNLHDVLGRRARSDVPAGYRIALQDLEPR